MTHRDVHRVLSEDPERPKIVSLNDGRRVRIAGRERFLAGPIALLVLDSGGDYVYIPYRNIASIRIPSRNHGARRGKRPTKA